MFFPLTRVEGPPGSGKSRFLAREAIRLIVQDGIAAEKMLILGVGSAHKNRLNAYLREEAKLASLQAVRVSVTTLDEWLLGLINQGQTTDTKWGVLTDLQTEAILNNTLSRFICPTDTLYYASHQLSFSRMAARFIHQCQLQNFSPQDLKQMLASGSSRLNWLASVYDSFQEQCLSARLLTYPALIHQVSLLNLQSLKNLPQVIFIDEAQELSDSHYRFFSQLPLSLVMAGNEKLSVRSHRGAQPEAFLSFFEAQERPVTAHVLQACMRGNTSILSLLNAFLPQPVWEEQMPDLEQLASMVKFGYYHDPEAEALALADQIQGFVDQQRIENRPARWEDCAILLRSSHYKAHLISAFQQRRIPFWDEPLSEVTRHFQRDFYALLHVFDGWERLALQAEHFTSPKLMELLQKSSLSTPDKAAFMQADNRHLTHWLESCLQEGAKNEAIQHLKASKPEENKWLLPQWLDEAQTPPAIVDALRTLIALYEVWLSQRDPVYLTAQAIQALLPPSLPVDDSPETFLFSALEKFQQRLSELVERFQKTTGKPVPLSTLLGQYPALWQAPVGHASAPKGVQLLSIHQAQGETFPWVAIPFLVSDEFPNQRDSPEILGLADQVRLNAAFSSAFAEAEEKRLFAVGASRASHRLVLSSHRKEGTEIILPSPFYTALLAEKRRLLNQSSQSVVCWCEKGEPQTSKPCEIDACSRALGPAWDGRVKTVETERPRETYQGASLWANLQPQQDEPVFAADFELTTSPTAISNYMKCPRQFYYKHLLGLPEAGNAAASLGTLVHKVMEVFNSQTPLGEYTPQRLIDIAEALFDFESNPDHFHLSGFGERERRELSQMSPLSQSALKARLLASIEDLTEKGYFDRYGTLQAVHAEKEFKAVAIEGIARCRFKGKVDALIQRADGLWEVIDYKTYGPSKYGTGWALCEQKFQKSLDPLPDEEAMPHQERFADKMNGSYPLDYQLPLYYLACLSDPAYKDKLAGVSLQLVRPRFPDNPQQGAIRLSISAEALEAQKAQLTQDIQAYIVNPILESQQFATTPAVGACDYCAYAGICEMGQPSEEGGEPL
jgi:superfamily I DNA/RNA helicase